MTPKGKLELYPGGAKLRTKESVQVVTGNHGQQTGNTLHIGEPACNYACVLGSELASLFYSP